MTYTPLSPPAPSSQQWQWQPVAQSPRVDAFAITALVLGICASFLGWLYLVVPVLAIVFGSLSIRKIHAAGGWKTGKGMAIAGLVLGIVFAAAYGGLFLLALLGSSS